MARSLEAGDASNPAGQSTRVEVTLRQAEILDAFVSVLDERGFARTTVGDVCARAKVSRATFYATFESLEACLAALIDEAELRARDLMIDAFDASDCWHDGVCSALAGLLDLFDDRPQLARVWFVETLAAGSWALERRNRVVTALTAMIVSRWPLPPGLAVSELSAAGVVESILGIVHARVLAREERPLVELLGPLMGMIAATYLENRTAVAEIERRAGERAAGALAARHPTRSAASGEPVEIPRLLRDRRAHRARQCLLYLIDHPSASNRQIARAVGIASDSHISTLLARIAREGLLVRQSGGPGAPNAWSLTRRGYLIGRMLQRLSLSMSPSPSKRPWRQIQKGSGNARGKRMAR